MRIDNATLKNCFARTSRQLESDILEKHGESTQWVEDQLGLSKRQPLLQVRESGFELILLGGGGGTQKANFICRYHPTSRAMHFE